MREELVASWVSHDGIPYVTVDGELNISTKPLLDKTLCEARTDEPFALIVSLERCTYCDSAGLSVLMRHARQTPHFVVISPDGSAMRKLLRVTHLDEMFDVVATAITAFQRCSAAAS